MQKATFSQRLAAYIIDVIIVAIVFGLVNSLGSPFSETLINNFDNNTAFNTLYIFVGASLATQLLNLALAVAYYGGLWATTGQTLGQKVLRIKVVQPDGSKLTWENAILRYLGYILNSLFVGLGFLWALWDKEKQGWHDKLAGAYVVKV